MDTFNKKKHWETIYQTRNLTEVSWFQPIPETSLQFIKELNLPLNSKIIDIGGGDSYLVDYLLRMGYIDVSVLDISEASIRKAKTRLGNLSEKIKWICADVSNYHSNEKYDLWHDRAAFHFLNQEAEIKSYLKLLNGALNPGGLLVMGTFSKQGPTKCSGLAVKQYSEKSLSELFSEGLEKIKCRRVDHITPTNAIQNFIFCSFRKI